MRGSIRPFQSGSPRDIAPQEGSQQALPGIMEALGSLWGDLVRDGELVALDPQDKPSFQLLQHNILQSLPIYCYAFDLPNKNGDLLVNLPLSRRREGVQSANDKTDSAVREVAEARG